MIPTFNVPFVLRRGHSDDPAEGTCAMAAIAWLAHGTHTDAPSCASPAITRFVIPANDAMDDATRQRFIPFLHRIAGSRSPEHEAARVRIMWLAAIRVFAPRALDAAGLHDRAAALRALPDRVSAPQARQAAAEAAKEAMWAEAGAAAEAAEAAAWAARLAAEAEAEAAEEAGAAAEAAARGAEAAVWDDYFAVLDEALRAGPEGEPWSADAIEAARAAYRRACGQPSDPRCLPQATSPLGRL
jgi:hypothetical protein